jgi:methionyl-tRNA formyltransferase
MRRARIMFMGTPEFAACHLKALFENGYPVCAAVTQPDRPRGRKKILTPPEVKVYACEHGIPVYQPERLRDGAFESVLREVDPELIVVVAYGRILPKYVLDYPKYGCINIHGSLLPKYRGAAPMQRAIIDGETETGVCSMFMDEGMDTGDILETASCGIAKDDDFAAVHDRLAELGCRTLLLTLEKLMSGTLVRTKQDESLATVAPKIENSDCVLDFNESSKSLHDRIRGLSPAPLARCVLNGRGVKFVCSDYDDDDTGAAPGTVCSVDGGKIRIACGKGSLYITELLPDGKRKMSAADFVNGKNIAAGDVFSKCE